MNYKVVVLILLVVLGIILAFNFWPESKTTTDMTNTNQDTSNAIAVFTTNYGQFEIELFTDQMPITTGNFIKLAENGFYDDTRFHRVIPDFMIQAGDPLTKTESDNISIHGTGGPGYSIEDEFVEGLSNTRGTIAMANSGQPNSGGSQFFINLADNTFLDFDKEPLQSKHPVFGQVISGMEVVDEISGVATRPEGEGSYPAEPVVIEKIEIN